MTANTNPNDQDKSVTSPGTPGEPFLETTTSDSSMLDRHFECPHCDVSYSNETLTRVHVTRNDDDDHVNHDGLMPETEITVRDADTDDYIETVTRRPKNINVQSITRDDLPDDLTDRHAEIVLVATWNPYETDYSNLEEQALERFEQYNLDPLSYSTVRRVTRRFYGDGNTGNRTRNMTSNKQPETLSDGTTKQQAVIIARLAHPEDSDARIAERIGTAQSYPSQIYDRFDDVIARLDTKIKNGSDLKTTVVNDLNRDDLGAINEQNLLSDTGVNIDNLIEAHELFDTAAKEESGASDNPPFDQGVSTQNDVMAASPYDKNGTQTDGECSDDTLSAGTGNEPELIPRAAVEELRNRLIFQRRLGERVEEHHGGGDQEFRIAFTELVEEELDKILDH
jgi:hypothetical protein